MWVPSSLSSPSSSLSDISLLRNLGAQALECPREPRFDGSSRATQDRGRLHFGEPQEIAAGGRPPRLLTQAAPGLEQLFSPLSCQDRRFGRGRAVLRRTLPRRPQEQTGAARGGPALISGLVGDYREQPGPETGARPEASQGAVSLHECLLGRFLGLRGVARDEVGGTEGHLLVAAHQLLIRRSVSTLRTLGELRVIRGDGPPPRRRSLPSSTTPGAKRFPACLVMMTPQASLCERPPREIPISLRARIPAHAGRTTRRKYHSREDRGAGASA